MNRQLLNYLPFINDFIYSMLKSGVELSSVVLYGSILSGDLTKTSDIDIKVFSRGKNNKAIEIAEKEVNKKILSEGFTNLIHSIIEIKPSYDHIEDGLLLYGKPFLIKAKDKGLNEMSIITYDTTNLDKGNRVKLSITLFGHKTKRKTGNKVKIYESDGLIDFYGGKTLRNAILIDPKKSESVLKTIKNFGIPVEKSNVYMGISRFIER
jgi:predicted nucleotidyltransferase